MKNNNYPKNFQAFAEKMQNEHLPEVAITNFENHFRQLVEDRTGFIPESDISPVDSLPDSEHLDREHSESGRRGLSRTVLIKLNGGLGTSMGLNRAKSLIRVKQDYSFLDIIVRHAMHARVHLLLMNSFNTREDSLQLLKNYDELDDAGLGLDFVQHKVPKIRQHDLTPAVSPGNRQLEWCPPGHGDIYIALLTSGMLDKLLHAGYRYALISNSDNLGATLDTNLLGYLVDHEVPFLMEVTDRTRADSKGGHLARLPDGRLVLRESAQCPEADRDKFEDVARHRFFNTNNLWITLQDLKDTLNEKNNVLDLPLIRNSKTVDPRDRESEPVYQLETAMGSAISVFRGAQAIRVPRSRFAPVKTTSDLLLVRSDVFDLRGDYTLVSSKTWDALPLIRLDGRYYGLVDDFEARFPGGPPSLLACEGLEVHGDIVFGKNIRISGTVCLTNDTGKAVSLEDNASVDSDLSWR